MSKHLIKTKKKINVDKKMVIDEYKDYLSSLTMTPSYERKIIGPNNFSELMSWQRIRKDKRAAVISSAPNNITRPNNDSGEDIIQIFDCYPFIKLIEVKGNANFDNKNRNREHIRSSLEKSFSPKITKVNSSIQLLNSHSKTLSKNSENEIKNILEDLRDNNKIDQLHTESHIYTYKNDIGDFEIDVESNLKSSSGPLSHNQLLFNILINKEFDIDGEDYE